MRNPCAKPSEHIAVWKAAQGEPSREAPKALAGSQEPSGLFAALTNDLLQRGLCELSGQRLASCKAAAGSGECASACLPRLPINMNHYAGVAQTAEQLPCKQRVAGSMPAVGSSFPVCGSVAQSGQSPWFGTRMPQVQILPPRPLFADVTQVGRVPAFQAGCCRFEAGRPLHPFLLPVAQLEERQASNLQAGGSSPPGEASIGAPYGCSSAEERDSAKVEVGGSNPPSRANCSAFV